MRQVKIDLKKCYYSQVQTRDRFEQSNTKIPVITKRNALKRLFVVSFEPTICIKKTIENFVFG